MDISLSVQFDTKPLESVLAALPAACDLRKPPLADAGKNAMRRLIRWEQSRFMAASSGDGTWAPLKPATVKARLRKQYADAFGGKGTLTAMIAETRDPRMKRMLKGALKQQGNKLTAEGRKAVAQAAAAVNLPILFVTGALEFGLYEDGSGHFQDVGMSFIREGVRGGSHSQAPISVGALAVAHHFGVPQKNLPSRPVMFPPDETTLNDMGAMLHQGVNAAFTNLVAQFGGGPARVA